MFKESCGIPKCSNLNVYLYVAVPALVAVAVLGLCVGLCCMRRSSRGAAAAAAGKQSKQGAAAATAAGSGAANANGNPINNGTLATNQGCDSIGSNLSPVPSRFCNGQFNPFLGRLVLIFGK